VIPLKAALDYSTRRRVDSVLRRHVQRDCRIRVMDVISTPLLNVTRTVGFQLLARHGGF